MKKALAISAAIAALPLAMSTAAHAGPLGWTEVGVGYSQADSGEDEVTAYDVRGGIGLGNLFHIQGGYLTGSADPNYDFDGYDLRAGVHPSVGEKTQAVVDLIYFDYSGEGDDGEDGYGLGFGVRHQMGDQFEVTAMIDYIKGTFDFTGGSEDFTETHFRVGGRYYWTPAIFTGVSVALDGGEAFSIVDGGDVIRADVGWSFGGDVM